MLTDRSVDVVDCLDVLRQLLNYDVYVRVELLVEQMVGL